MDEAERLTRLTSPRAARMAELYRLQDGIDTLSDAQIVDLVETAIRDNPKGFPSFTKIQPQRRLTLPPSGTPQGNAPPPLLRPPHAQRRGRMPHPREGKRSGRDKAV